MKRKNRIILLITLIVFFCSCNNRDHDKSGKSKFEENYQRGKIKREYWVCQNCIKIARDELKHGNLVACYKNINDKADYFMRDVLFEYFGLIGEHLFTPGTYCEKYIMDSIIFKKYGKDVYTIAWRKSDSLSRLFTSWQLNDSTFSEADIEPFYKGGKTFRGYDLMDKQTEMLKSKHQLKNAEKGAVELKYFIDKKGNMQHLKIYRHLNPTQDSIAVLIMKELPNKWIPASIDGKPVCFSTYYSIRW
jgi:hypothetical protein